MSNKSVFVPMVTPVDNGNNVCQESVEKIIVSLSDVVDGFVPCLTSGEGWKLSDNAWKEMLETCIQVAGDERVMVGIERPSTESVLHLLETANRCHPKAVVITTPFGENVSQQEMIIHFEKIAVNSDCDIVIYNENALSRNVMDFPSLLEVAKLNNVVGIKDSPDAPREEKEISSLKRSGLRYYIGWEESLHTGVVNDGNIVSMSSVAPHLCIENVDIAYAEPKRQLVLSAIDEYRLSDNEWYRHIKNHLYQRGVIKTPSLVLQ